MRNINGPELVEDIVEVCRRFDDKPVLYLTNDHMVRTVALAREEIKRCCRFNWPSGIIDEELAGLRREWETALPRLLGE